MKAEDEMAIRNLIARLAWLTDKWTTTEEVAANYTPDCSWQIRGNDAYVGHEGIARRLREVLAGGICGPGLSARHCVTSLEIIDSRDDDKSALARSHTIMVTAEDGRSSIAACGDYLDEVRRESDGQWRIVKRLVIIA